MVVQPVVFCTGGSHQDLTGQYPKFFFLKMITCSISTGAVSLALICMIADPCLSAVYALMKLYLFLINIRCLIFSKVNQSDWGE
jgi:hypothetical protein